ncbi:hypothetical protein LOTGIDRAFT_161953 [Lottia gigantea]|uniref:Cadherin domain-containing protein n=1 Tax=Lottia gigantea TaxID=225164 RepID=V4AIT0_LOTGI|nr:hypothetical protein LOTGIDRAFT_161953 [Lottia gigantea]ESO93381.1 hypothetical protein LOTGIDRAFT_161953 [Lottia gigantea]
MINKINGLNILLIILASITRGRTDCDYDALKVRPNIIKVSENTTIGYVLFNVTSLPEVIVKLVADQTNCYNFLAVKPSSTQTVHNIVLNKTLDAETVSSECRFLITCVNAPSSEGFSVKIIDLNEYPPVFTQDQYTVNISESTELNTAIFETRGIANDKDKENQYIIYKLQDGLGHFRFFGSRIYTTKQFDYDEMQRQFNLTIIAEEDGDNLVKKNSSVILTVDILDVDDQSPRFTQTIYRLNISEDNYNNRVVNTTPPILAIDRDSFNTPVNYNITTGGDGIFTIRQTGELVINGRLIRKGNPSLALGIQAYQIDRPSDRTDDAAVIITVQDVNDHHPIMTNDTYIASVDEGSFGDFTIIQVTASDSDIGINSVFQFHLNGTDVFEIETVNDVGSIRLARGKILDREETEVHNFEVYAKELETDSKFESNRSLVQIIVNDINDNKPIFYSPSQPFTFTVNKTAKIGDLVGKVFANDSDIGNNGEVRYQLLQAGDEFRINVITGEILVNKSLINRNGIINVQILAKDLPKKIADTRQTIQSGVIKIVDVNIGPPNITNLNSTISIPEDIPIHTTIYTVEATDPDITDGNSLLYYIVSQSSYGGFTIDSSSGTIKTNDTLDREIISLYRLLIIVSDGSKNSSHGYLTINILDINDHNPVFYLSEYNFTIIEGSGQLTGDRNPVNASDSDIGSNALLTYSLLTPRGTTTPLEINNTSGLLSTTSLIDREERDVYDLYVMATDDGTPKRSSAVSVVVTVLDINDNSPIFPKSNISLSFPEDSYPDCFYKAKATDRDIGVNNQILYTTNDATIIEVSSDGDVCVKDNQSLPLGPISITIIAYNIKPYIGCTECNNASLYLFIEVTDVNNNVPIFDQPYYNFSIDEGLNTHQNLRVHAKDNDTTSLYQNVLYSVLPDIDNRFTIDSITGQIHFNTVPDYETKKIFQLTVGARDTGQSEVQTTVNVTIYINDVNDNYPVFSKDKYECTVYENQTSGLIPECQVTATDKDTGSNQKIVYSILENVPFSIDSNTGNVSVNGGLDYDNGSRFYTIRIEASDNGSRKLSRLTQMVIEIINTNDNAPTFRNTPYNFTILEIQPAGSLVGVISAVDADQDDLTYSMKSNIRDGNYRSTAFSLVTVHTVNEYSPRFTQIFNGNVSENAARETVITQVEAVDNDTGIDGDVHYSLTDHSTLIIFHIDNSTGVLTLNCDSCLDFTNKSMYEVIVQAIDGGSNPRLSFTTVEVTVQNINDKAPRFSSSHYSTTLKENTAINTTIFRVIASDADTPIDQLTFNLLNHHQQFSLAGPIVVVKSPVDGDLLKHPTLILNISVSDGTLSAYTLLTITILDENEHPPVLVLPNNRSWSLSLPENVTIGHEVVTIGASDKDFSNNGFTFWLTNEDDKFKINVSSGLLQVTNRFDRSIKDSYNVTVHVSDHGVPPLFAEQEMHIEILDSNTSPVFDNASYTFSVVENVKIEYKVGAVKATDKDYGSSGQIIYDIVSGNIGSAFRINSSNGQLFTDKLLDHEIVNYYTLTVEAKDMSSIPKSSTVLVEIEVEDIFEAPRWPATLPIHYVSKSKECEASQITAISSDASSSDSGTSVIYKLLNFNDIFQMDNKTGALQPASDIKSGNYTLILQACNSRNILLCSNATLNVIVTEQVRLIFCPVFVPVHVPEDLKLNTTITTMNTTLDEETNQFSIIEGNDGYFSLGLDNGVLKLKKALDRETVDTYTLSIQAVNLNNSQTATAQVIIRVTDINDCPPYFLLKTYYGEISEDASTGVDVFLAASNRPLIVNAKDNDLNPQLSYSVEPQSDYFNITGSTGLISLARKLDRENISSFNFEVIVSDGKFTNSTKVVIKILDVNDMVPVFDHLVYNKSVFENISTNSVILTVQATDQDISDRGSLAYKLNSNVSEFKINARTGEIQVVDDLDRETTSEYNISIVAIDNAGHNATTEVYIDVLDVNDNSPKFYQDIYNFSVQEGDHSVNKTFMVDANDDDIDENSRLKFRISKGNTGDFHITSFNNRANITIVNALDREQQGLEYINGIAIYNLIIEATDSGEPPQTGFCKINIQVSDINDNPPRFENSLLKYVGTVEENSTSGTPVVLEPALSVTDIDYGINGVSGLVYYLSPVSLPFSINNTTGEVTVSLTGDMTIDRETTTHYDLRVTYFI